MTSLDFGLLPIILFCVGLAAAIFVCGPGLAKTRRVGRRLPTASLPVDMPEPAEGLNGNDADATAGIKSPAQADGPLPGADVTVVVYAFAAIDYLDTYLERLMSQSLRGFRVVLVYDAGAEATAMLSERYAGVYPDLYITFVPPGSHNLSRRKLALTIGMKAATTGIVVTTTSNCDIPSSYWLEELTAPLRDDADVKIALGYSHYSFDELHGPGKWYRQFDHTVTSIQWLGSALGGRPYRGDRFNLAYRRDLFFDSRGFYTSLDLESGEDDIFVNDYAEASNTRVAVSPQSMLTTLWGHSAGRMWVDQKERYDFNRRWLPARPFIFEGMTSAARLAALGCLAASAFVALPSIVPAAAALAVTVAWWGIEIAAYRRAATRLKAVRLWWALPLFRLWRPLGNLIFKARHYRDRYRNFNYIGS